MHVTLAVVPPCICLPPPHFFCSFPAHSFLPPGHAAYLPLPLPPPLIQTSPPPLAYSPLAPLFLRATAATFQLLYFFKFVSPPPPPLHCSFSRAFPQLSLAKLTLTLTRPGHHGPFYCSFVFFPHAQLPPSPPGCHCLIPLTRLGHSTSPLQPGVLWLWLTLCAIGATSQSLAGTEAPMPWWASWRRLGSLETEWRVGDAATALPGLAAHCHRTGHFTQRPGLNSCCFSFTGKILHPVLELLCTESGAWSIQVSMVYSDWESITGTSG